MKKSLEIILPIADGISRLMYPFAEVVVHDLESDTIQAIYNPISKREVGDASYLDRLDFNNTENIIGPYEKINWDGRKLKSISSVIRNTKGKAEGFLCINFDSSVFQNYRDQLNLFLNNNAKLSQSDQRLFKDDLYEQINSFIKTYCLEKQVAQNALSREDKQELIKILNSQGAFTGKNAATYIARILGVSRATVYNYLKEVA